MVKSNPYTQTRLGKDIIRKGNKFGMWPNRERGKKIIVAHYYVQGERGEAKVRTLEFVSAPGVHLVCLRARAACILCLCAHAPGWC